MSTESWALQMRPLTRPSHDVEVVVRRHRVEESRESRVRAVSSFVRPPRPKSPTTVSPTITAQLQNEAAHLARLWSVPSLPTAVSIRLNRRLTTTLARYKRDTRTIEVGVRFLALRSRRSEVLAHELAHAAVHIRHGLVALAHGKEWQALVKAAGMAGRARMATGRRPSAKPRAARSTRYEHRCPVCHMVRAAKRPVTGWRCRACVEAGLEGALDITRSTAAR